MIKIGNGFDVHRLVAGRPFILGGVHIPFDLGPEGFSDGDPLTHAIIDSLLGAAGLGDIGMWFPPGDSKFADATSISLLKQIIDELKSRKFRVVNIDSTVLCEEPKLSPFFDSIKEKLSNAINIDLSQINVKATTTEKLGEIGKGQAVAVLACALVESF